MRDLENDKTALQDWKMQDVENHRAGTCTLAHRG